ncbi:MFS transporter [Clostridium kluyveri]|uniref:MFS transporter n=2 Tax=Clostridium kluyveri TaxID=1534 RepID=A0A1L5F936_CLOKL|nr:MFS transporter [Clostridium kluyveri]
MIKYDGSESLYMNKNWEKNIMIFLASQTISLFGTSLVQYAIIWFITLKTQSGIMMTISIVSGFLPIFFLSPLAGVWADRYDRKILIILSDSFIAMSTFILAILFLLGYDKVWLLFVISAIRALGTAVQTPAIGAFIPQLIPENKLTKINAVNGSIQSIVMLISPMVSGALLTITKIEIIFFIDVVTAAAAIFMLVLFLHVPAHNKALRKQTNSYFVDMKKGITYIKNHEYIKKFFLFCIGFFFLSAPAAFLTPLQVSRSFGNDVWRLTSIEIAFSSGMILGGVAMAYWGGFKNRIYTMTLSSFLIGACTFFLGVTPNFVLYLIFMGLVGIAIPLFNTPSMVLLQEKVQEDFLGRVFGVLTMISSSMMPLGMLIFGPISDMIKIEWLLIGTGIFMFIQSFFLISSKILIENGESNLKTE